MFVSRDILENRKRTVWIATLHAFFVGIQYSCMYASLLYYLKEMIQVGHSEKFYGIILALTSIASTCSGIYINRKIESFNKLRNFIIFIIVLTIAGNILYSFQFSIWFVYIGAFICGIGDSTQSVIFFNLSKCYDEAELLRIRTRYELTYTAGFTIGPFLVAMTSNLDFYIQNWHLNKYNGIFFIIGMSHFIVLVLVYHFASNNLLEGPKEEKDPYDLENEKLIKRKNYIKAVMFKDKVEENIPEEKKEESSSLKLLLVNPDVALISFVSFNVSFLSNNIEILITVTAILNLHLNLTVYACLLGSCLIFYTFVLSRIWNWYFDKKNEFTSLMTCLVLNTMACFMIILSNLKGSKTSNTAKAILLVLTILTNYTAGIGIYNASIDTYGLVILDENLIVKIEESRSVCHRLFGLIGLAFAGFFYVYIQQIYLSILIFNIFLCIAVFLKGKKLKDHDRLDMTLKKE